MAVTLTVEALSNALRLGSSTEETEEATRLLAYSSEAVLRHAPSATDTALNEAAIRLSGFLYDQPNAGRGLSFAHALRNSGAAAILLPYRIHRAGSTSEAIETAQQAVGTVGNPVIGVTVSGSDLVISFADGTTQTDPLPAGGGGGMFSGTDQTARDAAAAAQTTADGAQTAADAAQADLDTHEGTPHNHDTTARDAAAAAQGTAAAAQADLDTHERAPHNTDGTARTAAAAAQARADDAYTLADGKVDSSGAASAARGVVADWAEDENLDPIPAPKLVNVVTAHVDIANVLDGRLPGLPVAMRLGWSQSRMFTELDFDRPLPPIGGSVVGMSDGLGVPPFPPGIAGDPTLFLGIWLAGDPDVAELPAGFAVADKSAITVDGAAGVYFASTERLPASVAGNVFKVFLVGDRIVTESDLAAHVSDPDAHHVPPTGSMGGGPVVLYEATAAIGTATGLIAGNVACPETGALEFYFEGLTGTRQGGVAYARIPAARIRGAVSALAATYSNDNANLLAIPHGANRGVGVAVQATTNFLMLSAQAPGDFFIRVAHTG